MFRLVSKNTQKIKQSNTSTINNSDQFLKVSMDLTYVNLLSSVNPTLLRNKEDKGRS